MWSELALLADEALLEPFWLAEVGDEVLVPVVLWLEVPGFFVFFFKALWSEVLWFLVSLVSASASSGPTMYA